MSFPRYPKYEDSGVEWLGDVPTHWEFRRLKSLVEEPLKYGANESAELDDRTQPRFVRITDIDDAGNLRDETFKSLPAKVAEPYLPKDGDVLLARSGATVGKSFIYSKEWGTACFAGYLIRARLRDSQCLPRWLYYFCQTDGYWGYVVGSQIQATIQNVSAEKYANLYLPIPPREEQSLIAAFLDRETAKIDGLVAEQRRLIELLKEKRQAVISHAVTKGLNVHAPMKPSGIEWLGDVPEHWEVKAMRNIANVVRGASPRPAGDPLFFGGGAVPWVTVAEITKDDLVDLTETETLLTEVGASHSKLFKKGTLIYSNSGATLGVPKILRIDACANDGVVAFERLSRDVHPQFLYHYLASITNAIREKVKQGSGQPNLNTDIVKALRFGLPPMDEQELIVRRIADLSETFGSLTTEAQRAIDLLQERRTALISAAVTGKIDVRGLVETEAA
jgi:type I restriction enzyme, S subunit